MVLVSRSYNMFYAHLDILKYPQICTNCVTIHFQIEILTACGLDRVLIWQKQVFGSQNTVKIIHRTIIDRAHQIVIEISTILLQRTRASRPWKVWPLVAAVDCWHPPKHFSPGWHSVTLHRSQQQSVAIGDSCSIALWPGPNVLNCRWWGCTHMCQSKV